MSEASRRARTYEPGRTWDALLAQAGHVRRAVRELTAEQWAADSGLPGWDVRTLVVHVVRQVDAVPELLAQQPLPPATQVTGLSRWALSTAGIADRLDEDTRQTAAATEDPAAALDAATARAAELRAAAVRTDLVVPHVFTAMRALDFTVTRLVELVVHSDDLARATGVPVTLDRQALAATVRVLADALAVKAPGGSVEVRVPPYAAVQCVEGPRHTRGTPPNVVETDPLTWVRLATGRLTWSEALDAAAVRASGERADLAAYLPVMG